MKAHSQNPQWTEQQHKDARAQLTQVATTAYMEGVICYEDYQNALNYKDRLMNCGNPDLSVIWHFTTLIKGKIETVREKRAEKLANPCPFTFKVLHEEFDVRPLLEVLEFGGPETVISIIDKALYLCLTEVGRGDGGYELCDEDKSNLWYLKRLRDAIIAGSKGLDIDRAFEKKPAEYEESPLEGTGKDYLAHRKAS